METMKKIDNIQQALDLFEKYSISQGKALDVGNSRVANYNYDRIEDVVRYLREKKELSRLSVFYTHSNAYGKQDSALDAEMTIKEWKKGNLRNFYTLQLFISIVQKRQRFLR